MTCNCCVSVYLIPVAIALYFVYKHFFAAEREEPQPLEKNYKQDVVYLYQFPRSKSLPNLSPYCLKIETFLRVNKIPYETRGLVVGRSKYGLLPFIELNGKHIADSQLIYEHLVKHFKIKTLPAEQEALSRAVSRTADGHTFYVFYKFKVMDLAEQFANVFLDDTGVPAFLKPIFLPIGAFVLRFTGQRRVFSSLGKFSDQEFEYLLRKDLDTYRSILGNKKFLFGDNLSIGDYSVFGMLAATFYLPFSTKISELMRKEYQTLVDYCERIRHLAFEKDFTQ